jgi:tRNA(Ile)-lysidine synthase
LTGADADILSVLRKQLGSPLPKSLGVAVSGGGDSVALMHALAASFQGQQVALHVATVDHGLRPAASQEAAEVGRMATALGLRHAVLKWTGWDGQGNLQDQARRARYRLLADWAVKNDLPIVALGHTADDQAETLLMRLARSAGVDGLAGMPVRRCEQGVTFVRPFLGLTRADLRAYLVRHDVGWIDDPTNEDLRFDRIRARQALAVLEPLGITVSALTEVAGNMASARAALEHYLFLAAQDCATVDAGDVVLDMHRFRALPDEIARRLLLHAITWINGADYPPRRAPVSEVLTAMRDGRAATLGGCLVLPETATIRLCREYNAVRSLTCPVGETWDRRWRLHGGDGTGCTVRALGENGVLQCPDWRKTGRPHAALVATPAVWRGDDLVAAPLAGMADGWQAELVGGAGTFLVSLLSH